MRINQNTPAYKTDTSVHDDLSVHANLQVPFRTTWVNLLLDEKPQNFHVSTLGDVGVEQLLFPELGCDLRQSSIDATAYEVAVSNLPEEQRSALRTWCALDLMEEGSLVKYSDGSRLVPDGMNYEINKKLSSGERLSALEKNFISHLDTALQNMPVISGEFLRVVEHSDKFPSPWGSLITVGDCVTNAPCYMSASTSKNYAVTTLTGEDLVHPDETHTVVLYKIIANFSHSTGVPLLRGAVSAADEEEVLFRRGSCFIVEGVSIAKPENDEMTRVAVILRQTQMRAEAKNIFSAASVNTN